MKKLVLIMAAMLMAGSAMAILDDTPNSVGLYWDLEADIVEGPGCNYSPFKEGHVLITNPTFNTFKALEMSLTAKSNGSVLPYDGIIVSAPMVFGANTMFGSPPTINMALAAPAVVGGPVFEVATLTFLTTAFSLDPRYTNDRVEWYIDPLSTGTIPGACAILPVEHGDYVVIQPLAPYGSPIAIMNDFIVAAEETNFGSVKSLYR